MSKHLSRCAVILFAICVVVGCDRSPKPVPVTGAVTVAGKPVHRAAVLFYREKAGRPFSAQTDAGGQFQMMVLPGEYGVAITACEPVGPSGGEDASDLDEGRVRWIVPMRFSRIGESKLTASVSAGGANHFPFECPAK